MIFLWSTVGSIWPSILGLILLGLTGINGEGYEGVKAVSLNAYGSDTVLIVLLGMVLFGAIEHFDVTAYISRWFVTRKIINGRPLVFLFMFFFGCYFLSAFSSSVISLLIVLAITREMLESFGVTRDEKLWPLFIVGSFLATTAGHPFLPFKGAQLVVLSAYTNTFDHEMGYGPWMAFNLIMDVSVIVLFILPMRFFFRADLSKIKDINVDFF